MSMAFTKLFASITESTVWCEPDTTRITWIAMLAMADAKGRVWASIPGLANRARVTTEQAEIAINTFLSPDKYSRTADHDGRRIEPIDGGWKLLNYEKYRSIRDAEATKESKREYINKRRAAERDAKLNGVENVEPGRTLSSQEEEEADLSASLRSSDKRGPRFDPLAELVRRGVEAQVAADWLAHRKTKKAAVTLTVIDQHEKEAVKANMTLTAALATSCSKGWVGFNAEWVLEKRGVPGAAGRTPSPDNFAAKDYGKGVRPI